MSDIDLDSHIDSATKALLARQHADGHFQFELEADATVPAEYVLFRHYLGEPVDAALEASIAGYLRRIQGPHGGWALFADGAFDMSATVKAYFALKMIGDSPQAEHMRRAREAVRLRGGAERSNVFTRCLLALYGIISWRAVPVMPVEIMLLPTWFPFHLDKVSYWSRTVIVPLLVLMAKKPRARNPKEVGVAELFLEPPRQLGPTPKAPQQKASWFWFFRVVDNALRAAEPWFPKKLRQRAIDRAVAWVDERLNGEDGLGAILPAMANSVMMYDALGVPAEDSRRAIARKSIDKLLAVHDDETYCQPCVSPIWDTALACHALLEVGGERAVAEAKRALDWLIPKQVLDLRGDWISQRPNVRPGGWAFQYANPYYPDVDDTAAVALLLDRFDRERYRPAIERAAEWILGMQSRNGGWGETGDSYWPSAPRGTAPYSTPSQTAWALLGLMAAGEVGHPAVARGIAHLVATQQADGRWHEPWYTAVGFPRVFYLRYHGYPLYFPLWALARYRRLREGGEKTVSFGL